VAVIFALVWQWTPFMMLILLAGLQGRPLDVIEAARIDGANSWQIFRSMTLPHLRQYLELGALLGSIYIVQNFDAVFTITSGGLGTANLPYTIYQIFYQATTTAGLRGRRRRGHRHDHHRHLRAAYRLVAVQGGLGPMTTLHAGGPGAVPKKKDRGGPGCPCWPGCRHPVRAAGGLDGADLVPLRGGRRHQPAGRVRAAHARGLPEFFSGGASPWPPLLNSLTASVISTLLVLLLAFPAAYALSIKPVEKWTDVLFFFLSTKMLPVVAGLLPLYLFAQNAGLLDNIWLLIVLYTSMNLPIAVWMMRSFLSEVPVEMLEAASMDGASAARRCARWSPRWSCPASPRPR
jgi:ABC-type glycerol-3-phosphate transport system permease component